MSFSAVLPVHIATREKTGFEMKDEEKLPKDGGTDCRGNFIP